MFGIDVEDKKKPVYSLSALQKSERSQEGRGKSGRKVPRPKDEDLEVNPAPNSLAARRRKPKMTAFERELLEEKEEENRVLFGSSSSEKPSNPTHAKKKKRNAPAKKDTETDFANKNAVKVTPEEAKTGKQKTHKNTTNKSKGRPNIGQPHKTDKQNPEFPAMKSEKKPSASNQRTGKKNGKSAPVDASLSGKMQFKESNKNDSAAAKGIPATTVPDHDLDSESREASKYSDLNPKTRLNGSTIIEAIEVIVRNSEMEDAIATPDPSVEVIAREGDYKKLIENVARDELYGYDIVLQHMWVDKGDHYVNGGIVFKEKTIFILDSLRMSDASRRTDFNVLLRIASAAALTSGNKINPDDWTFVYASDAPKQRNSYDCGVFCISNAYAIANAKNFLNTPTSRFESNSTRTWIRKLLKENKLPIRLRGKPKMKDDDRHDAVEELRAIEGYAITITRAPINNTLIQQVERLKTGWSICAAKGCTEDTLHEQRQLLCIGCRRWYHERCQDLQTKENFSEYLYCTECFNKGELNSPTNHDSTLLRFREVVAIEVICYSSRIITVGKEQSTQAMKNLTKQTGHESRKKTIYCKL
jgi:hypothetical protein